MGIGAKRKGSPVVVLNGTQGITWGRKTWSDGGPVLGFASELNFGFRRVLWARSVPGVHQRDIEQWRG